MDPGTVGFNKKMFIFSIKRLFQRSPRRSLGISSASHESSYHLEFSLFISFSIKSIWASASLKSIFREIFPKKSNLWVKLWCIWKQSTQSIKSKLFRFKIENIKIFCKKRRFWNKKYFVNFLLPSAECHCLIPYIEAQIFCKKDPAALGYPLEGPLLLKCRRYEI